MLLDNAKDEVLDKIFERANAELRMLTVVLYNNFNIGEVYEKF